MVTQRGDSEYSPYCAPMKLGWSSGNKLLALGMTATGIPEASASLITAA